MTNNVATASLKMDGNHFDREMQKAHKRIKQLEGESKKASQQVDGMQRSMRGMSQAVAAVDGPLGGVSSRISSINSLLTSGAAKWALFGAGIAGASLILSKSIKEFEKVEQQQLKTQAILKATGFAAGISAEQLDAQARALALSTLASTEDVRNAQNVLLTFRAVTEDTFTRTLELAQDMAAAGFGTLESNAVGLGKALQDPITGLTLLTRQGTLTKSQMREIGDEFKRTGDLAKAQSTILRAIEEQVGGTGVAAAGGLSGAVDTLGQKWGELLEGFEKTTGAGSAVTGFLNTVSASLQGLTDQINPSVDSLTAKLAQLEDALAGTGGGRSARGNKDNLKSRIEVLKDQILEARSAAGDLDVTKTLASETEEKIRALEASLSEFAPEERERTTGSGRSRKKTDFGAQEEELNELLELRKTFNDRIAKLESERAEGEKTRRQTETDLAAGRAKEMDEELAKRQATFDKITEQALAADGKTVELENARYDRQKKEFDRFVADLQKKGLITLEIEQQIAKSRDDIERLHTEKVREENKKVVDFYTERFNRIHEQALQSQHKLAGLSGSVDGIEAARQADAEMEVLRAEREEKELAEMRERLERRGTLSQELKDQFRNAELEAEKIHQNNLLAIDKKAILEKIELERKAAEDKVRVAEAAFEMAGNLAKEGSKSQKAFFALQKVASLAMAGIKLHEAISKANAETDPYTKYGHIANAIAIGTSAITSIRGINIAHGGLDYVPKETTFLLDKGERVISPNQNKTLMEFLDREERRVSDMGRAANDAVGRGADITISYPPGMMRAMEDVGAAIIKMAESYQGSAPSANDTRFADIRINAANAISLHQAKLDRVHDRALTEQRAIDLHSARIVDRQRVDKPDNIGGSGALANNDNLAAAFAPKFNDDVGRGAEIAISYPMDTVRAMEDVGAAIIKMSESYQGSAPRGVDRAPKERPPIGQAPDAGYGVADIVSSRMEPAGSMQQQWNVYVTNSHPGAEVQTQKSERGLDIKIIENAVRRTIASDVGEGGGIDSILRNHYGLTRAGSIA